MSDTTETMSTQTARYSSVAIALHWIIALLVLTLIALGLYMDHASIDDPTPLHNLHKALGILVMLLVVVRVIWRLTHKAPSLPQDMPKQQRIAAMSVEGILYIFQILMPATGWLAMSAIAAPVVMFGLFSWPNIPLPESVLESGSLSTILFPLHQWLSWFFAGFIALHILAALYHRIIRRDQIIFRMLPERCAPKDDAR